MNIGAKLKELRIAKGLTQEELADRAELSKGFISQLERDLTSPSINTLRDILQCLGSDLKDFFNDDTDDQVVFHAADYFEKEDPELKSRIEWIIPNAQKNMMEPIRLTLAPGGSTYPDNPHEGEEFGYILSGSIVIHLGQKKFRARKGESFYFSPRRRRLACHFFCHFPPAPAYCCFPKKLKFGFAIGWVGLKNGSLRSLSCFPFQFQQP